MIRLRRGDPFNASRIVAICRPKLIDSACAGIGVLDGFVTEAASDISRFLSKRLFSAFILSGRRLLFNASDLFLVRSIDKHGFWTDAEMRRCPRA